MNRHSILESTLVKISIVIFCIFLLLYFYIASVYWDRELAQRELELFKLASVIESNFYNNKKSIDDTKQNDNLTDTEKLQKIHDLLQPSPSVTEFVDVNANIGLYDADLNHEFLLYLGTSQAQAQSGFTQSQLFYQIKTAGVSQLLYDKELSNWDGKGVVGIAIPIFVSDKIIGHVWAYLQTTYIFFQSFLHYAKVLSLGLILWIIALVIITRYVKYVASSLDDFSQMIIQDKLDKEKIARIFPELVPVSEKIKTHLDHVNELNIQLENSNQKLLNIMEGITDGFFSLDKNWRFTFVNRKAMKLLNNDNLIGRVIWEVNTDSLNTLTYENLHLAINEQIPMNWQTISGDHKIYYEYHAYPFSRGISVFCRDITESKRQEEELFRLERLNLIGQLAAGISHEVRNPLTTVRGFLQMMESRTDSSQNKEYMEIMISEIDRSNEIITDFLSLAKVNAESTKQENINEIILRIFPLLQADAFNSDKEVILELHEVPTIELNESEIRQLILNLVRNGLEETPAGGHVTISSYLQDEKAVLSIKDQGKGIPLEIQEKMGTPFMTTKETGTGLGLAISMGIADRHKAKFDFETSPNGTIFHVKFPIKDQF